MTINAGAGGFHVVSLSSSTTITSITWSGQAPSGYGSTVVIVLKYSGSASVTWTNVKWSSGVNPVLTGVSGKADMFTFTTYDGGSNWIGTVAAQSLDSSSL